MQQMQGCSSMPFEVQFGDVECSFYFLFLLFGV
jgi:hypothetical protein